MYYRYINSICNRPYKKVEKYLKAPGPKSCIVPGCVLDKDPRQKFKHKFDRWYKLPIAAQRLYWRTHPQYYP